MSSPEQIAMDARLLGEALVHVPPRIVANRAGSFLRAYR
jgi:hypothetical protein